MVWINPLPKGEFKLAWAGKVIEVNLSKVKVVDDEGEHISVDSKQIIKPVNTSDIQPVDDMINLSDLQECSISRNIHLRYCQDKIYTYTGGILVSVNPYKQLHIYSEKEIAKYQGKRLIELSPHIFAIGAQALANLKCQLQNQCIVISGETGSGKTESTKLLLNFLAASSSRNSIGSKIVQANPILEEFGNAKTTKNDNSSRFGKFIDISFRKDGTMKSASIQHYLLEKARIKSQNIGDRNYHIFYSMLAGLPNHLKDQLKISHAKDYFYLTQGNNLKSDGRDEKKEFLNLQTAFHTLNFTEKECHSIFQVLAVILHIGNFTFNAVQKGNEEETQISRNMNLKVAISILGVEEKQFIEALTHKTIVVEGTKVVCEMSIEQAMRSRDAFAMSLYNNLFSYVLTTINKSISDHKALKSPSIGILDIFGFEKFTSNSFEQLCINYANEHLQQFFVNHVFKVEQEEYNMEQINWDSLFFEDNKEVVQLIGLDKMSILVILDEQTKFPKGTDTGVVIKCNKHHAENKYYIMAKSEISKMFGIKHYAGTVQYSVDGFVEKNMNILSLQWREVIKESDNQFLKNLFLKELSSTIKTQTLSLGGQYRQSLDSLMTTLSAGNPFFIRCIKPNDLKKPNNFDRDLVCQQLRYSGMMETARIRQIGYPIRYTYEQFILRYRILVPGSPPFYKIKDTKGTTQSICEKYLNKDDYQFGLTKIFLKIPDEKLEKIRDKILTKSAITLQKNFRASRLRLRFLKMQRAAVVIQRYWRGHKPHATYLMIKKGYLRLQAVLRSRQLKYNYNKMRQQVIMFQAHCRGYLKRKEIKNRDITAIKTPPPVPVPKPRKSSHPDLWLDNYITDMFESAVKGKIDNISSDMKDYLKSSAVIDNVREIINKPGVITFHKFAAANFMGNVNGKFSNKILDQPLLDLPSPGDQMAATVIWVTILRFMGNLEENASWTKAPIPRTRKSIMSQLQATISKSFLHSKEFLDVLNALKEEECRSHQEKLELGRKKLVSFTLLHRNKLQQELQRANLETEALKNSYQEWLLGPPKTLLEKLHFILGHGILRPSLRDEIYCQICKQLTENPDPVSNMYGWILLSLCASTFPPTEKLAPTILHFLASTGNMLGSLRKLQRTLENGARNQPPSAFELSALKSQQRMFVDILLLDDSSVNLEIDPSSTAREIVKAVSSRKHLDDFFGYSIFLSLFGQTLSLESEGWFLMDGISQCEMRASEKGLPEITAPWTLVFRREIFPPWPLGNDPVSIHLTYSQIIKGVSLGEYRCTQECELSLLVAQHYYILYGKTILPEILDSLIKEVIPEPLLKQKNVNWSKLVSDVFEKSYFSKLKVPEENVKIDVVNFAKKKWPLYFSRYYEVSQLSGLYLGSSELLLALNSYGIFIVMNSTEIILKLHFVEIFSVDYIVGPSRDKDQIHLITSRQQRYIFQSQFAETVCKHANSMRDELLLRSKYAVATDDYLPPDNSFLRLSRGDLVVLSDNPSEGKWMKGHHVDSGHVGEFPKRLVKILPCTEKPPRYLLNIGIEDKKPHKAQTKGKPHSLLVKKHTLEGYATKYFRSDNKKKGQKAEELFKFSKSKLWSPLHNGLSSLSHIVTPMYRSVLHYMGDVPQSGQLPYTRTIFEPPLQHEVLRDELYCLLMKQITDNPSAKSVEKGFELMILATSLFPPSSVLFKELELWLDTRPCEMSSKCLQNLNTRRINEPRKYSHHWLELASVQDRIPILHPIIFPNNMEQVFEVDSYTTVNDLVEEISSWLGLSSSEGFSLIVVFEDIAVSIPLNEYLFDAILEACQFPKTAIGHETPKYVYDLMFVKKLWFNTYAGADRVADLVCHYYQELPKYLAGSHNCTAGDAMYLGALIFIAELDENRSSVDPSKEILGKIQHLVPCHLVHGLAPHEWLYGILKAYEENKDLRSDDAKITFLKVTQNWPNFGSAFFSVHSSSSMQDEKMTLVVNRNGLCLVHPFSQEIITCHNYSEIFGCSFTEYSFSLSTSNRNYTWYTKTARKVADLVSSYLDAFDTKYLVP